MAEVTEGALAAADLEGPFPELELPLAPPYPPMEARAVTEVPAGGGWLYEPKWDGFRCLAFKDGATVALQSKAGQPLGRYFPELVERVRKLPRRRCVVDGEIVVETRDGLSFDDLLQRIHPAASRIAKLARETPASFLAFDLLVDARGALLVERPLAERRERLERFFAGLAGEGIRLSPATPERAAALRWMRELAAAGFDGVVAKRLDAAYAAGERTACVKVKRQRTADCVVGGFRYAQKAKVIGSLLLGLYDEEGLLHHVGFAASFTAAERQALEPILEKRRGGAGFTGKAPGGPSRWSTGRSTEWVPLRPELVCEVRYDHFSGDRFRHGTKFLRWRPDKRPEECTFEQVRPAGGRGALDRLFA